MFITAALVLSVLMLAAEKSAFVSRNLALPKSVTCPDTAALACRPRSPRSVSVSRSLFASCSPSSTPEAPSTPRVLLARQSSPALPPTTGSTGLGESTAAESLARDLYAHLHVYTSPTLGALLATAFYYVLKSIKYWEINPGQDSTDWRDAPQLKNVSEIAKNVSDAIPLPIPGLQNSNQSTGSEETNTNTAVDAIEIGMAQDINKTEKKKNVQEHEKHGMGESTSADIEQARRAQVEANA